MSSLGIDGLVSGLDTTSLINSLMQVEAVPQTLLQNKVTSTQAMISALQTLNTKVAVLGSTASNLAKPGALDLFTATSSSTAATATAGTGAAAGQVSLVVQRVAQAQVTVTAPLTTWPDTPPTLTITGADGTATPITAATSSLDDMVTAINAAGIGVNALKVASGVDASGTAQYRLQLSSTETGAAGGFTLSGSTVTTTDIATAQDAEVTLWTGTTAEQAITSSSNTFTDLLPGVNVTVSAASSSPVTITVARDDNQLSQSAKGLVDSLNAVFNNIATNSAVSSSTDSSGTSKVTGGIFSGDGTVSAVNQAIMTAAMMPVNGHSPSEIGISINKSGTFDYDDTKFAAAMAADPAFVKSTLQELSTRISAAATSASDQYTGTITSTITSDTNTVKDLGQQIDDWDTRLAARKASLTQTYAALEVQLSSLKSQSSWLASQLNALPTPTTSSSSSSSS